MAGLGGIAGLVVWYAAMSATGLWSIFLAVLYSEHHGKSLLLFVGSLLLCGFGGGALVLFLGERLHLLQSQEELDQQAKPVSLFSEEDRDLVIMANDSAASTAAQNPALGVHLPPGLHWLLVLVLGVLTLGIFLYVWMIVQALWVRKVDRSSKTLLLYLLGFAMIVIAASVMSADDPIQIRDLITLPGVAAITIASFRLKDSLEDYSKNVGGPWISLSILMTLLFGPIYLQYNMNEVRSFLRETALASAQ